MAMMVDLCLGHDHYYPLLWKMEKNRKREGRKLIVFEREEWRMENGEAGRKGMSTDTSVFSFCLLVVLCQF